MHRSIGVRDMDLIFRDVRLEGWQLPADIGVRAGVIEFIGAQMGREIAARRTIHGDGMMASPLLIDPHHHLDCAYLSEPRNHSGTLEDAIHINARIKADRRPEEVVNKATRALREAAAKGTGWMRSHADVDPVAGLSLLQATLAAAERNSGLVRVQAVAFPQMGLVRDPVSADLMRAAMDEGADTVGGMPHAEANPQDAQRHIDICFDLAQAHDADIDMHVDESDDPNSRTLEMVAQTTIREGYQGRVTAGHCCALAAYPDEYARRVIDLVAQAGIHVVTNPMVNMYLQGRHDPQPVRRGITRVRELMAAGVNVSCGLDDVKNMFFPFGNMDMLEVARFTAITAHLSTADELIQAFDMPRRNAAKLMGLEEYEIEVGSPANFMLLDAPDAEEALRLAPPRRYVIRRGRIAAENVLQRRVYDRDTLGARTLG